MVPYKKKDSPGNLYDGKKSKKSNKDKHPGTVSEEKSATPNVGYVKVSMFS